VSDIGFSCHVVVPIEGRAYRKLSQAKRFVNEIAFALTIV
jgi:hypothetical protein